MNAVLAVVEIGSGAALWALIAAVFVVTFLTVVVVALRLAGKKPRKDTGQIGSSGGTTWSVNLGGSTPLSKETVDIVTRSFDQLREPALSEIQRPQVEALNKARGVLLSGYRGLMIAVGLVGLIPSISLLLAHTPANMLGLPGGIGLVLSLGALLNGLIPGRSLTRSSQAIDFRPLLDKVRVNVERAQPLQVTLNDAQMARAIEMIQEGLPLSEAARAVYPEFDRLDEASKQMLESALQQLAKTRRETSG